MASRTYQNATNAPATVSWTTPTARSVLVEPAALFTFDPAATNGDEIDAACQAAGLTLEA